MGIFLHGAKIKLVWSLGFGVSILDKYREGFAVPSFLFLGLVQLVGYYFTTIAWASVKFSTYRINSLPFRR